MQHEEISAHKNTDICIVTNAVLSGTVSELGGGKFANGAITGAFVVMFNDLMHKRRIWDKQLESIFNEYRSMADVFKDDPLQFYISLGGPLAQWAFEAYKYGYFSNTCAAKLSYALNNSGFPIPAGTKGAYLGADNQYYIIKASDMEKYLNKVFTGHKVSSVMKVKNAIISQKLPSSPTVSGHIDVVFRGKSASRNYYEGETKYYR